MRSRHTNRSRSATCSGPRHVDSFGPRGQPRAESDIEKCELSQMELSNPFCAFSRKRTVLQTRKFYLTQPHLLWCPASETLCSVTYLQITCQDSYFLEGFKLLDWFPCYDNQIFKMNKVNFWHGPTLHSGTDRLGYYRISKKKGRRYLLYGRTLKLCHRRRPPASQNDDAWGRVLPTARLSFCIKQRTVSNYIE